MGFEIGNDNAGGIAGSFHKGVKMAARFTNPAFARESNDRRRLKVFYLVMWIGYMVIVMRGVTLMLQDNKKLGKIAMRQYRAAIQQATDRSRILDSRGQELAISIPAWSLYADPKEIANPQVVASLLSGPLGISKETLHEKLKERRRFVWLKRRLDQASMDKVRQLDVGGIYSIKENMRAYPHGSLAGSVLGAVGVDSQPLGGIEMTYDPYLMITSQSGAYLKDARGQIYVTSSPVDAAISQDKGDVHLTIDKNLQYFAEESLGKAVQKHNAKGGTALVMDPATGAILAMALEPSFNPGHLENVDMAALRNRSITDVYEPGSTFKVITAAAALESKSVALTDKFNCEKGSLQIDNHVIHDHLPYDVLTLSEIIKVSSNIGIYKVEQRVGKQKFYETIRGFGFGSKTGIDFPGEVSGLVRPVEKWRAIEAATTSFGQGIGVTALQLLSAFGTIANGGVRMRPHLVEKVVGRDGKMIYQADHAVLNQPVSPATSRILTEILEGVVGPGGTATAAAIAEYPVAGKTGTAQKVDSRQGGYVKGKFVASFIGYAPANNPRLVVLVLLDEPQGSYYGGVVAAPAFREIMLQSLHYLGVQPQGKDAPIIAARTPEQRESPAPPSEMTREGNFFKVPDFQGVSLRQVLKSAGEFPVEMEFKGRGEAVSQRPQAGSLVTAGSKIYVEFQPLY
ncbi:MAG: penicillin-binding protein [Deltaproteobacteria bacterium]|nr:penicillin-binding protein [Deltaproteobacteria bacterium]